MATQLHFQPIQGRTMEIINAILHTEEVASATQVMRVIYLVVEEVVVNIVEHAYPEGAEGYIDVEIERQDERITFCFRDGGMPFNPLTHEPPDTSLPIDRRPIGGLGIFLVIKEADAITYDYSDNENVLTVSLQTNKQ